MKTISLPPSAPVLMEATRAVGYSVETAIADIIDNSIAALATRVDIDFFPSDNPYISILDNGCGMDRDTLINAMKYGSSSSLDIRSSTDLGRYGLGLKTASMSQCRILTVISKQGRSVCGYQWNLNVINETNDWTLIEIDPWSLTSYKNYDKLSSLEHGTLVVWQDLDKFAVGSSDIESVFNTKMPEIRRHIALVFHRFLSGEPGIQKLAIYMNGLRIEPRDPFLIGKSTQTMDKETFYVQGQKIVVTPYTLPHTSKLTKEDKEKLGDSDESLRKTQGFYVYRNKRLLVWGTWFRLMRQDDLTKLARVQVDIPNSLDSLWALDIKKSSATPPAEVRKNLKIISDKIVEGSKRTWTFRGKKEVDDKVVHVWDRKVTRDGVRYEINRDHPMIVDFLKQYPGSKSLLSSILDQIASSLPLNKLYSDLGEDEKLLNETDMSFESVLELFRKLLDTHPQSDRAALIDTYICIEPFCFYRDEILDALGV